MIVWYYYRSRAYYNYDRVLLLSLSCILLTLLSIAIISCILLLLSSSGIIALVHNIAIFAYYYHRSRAYYYNYRLLLLSCILLQLSSVTMWMHGEGVQTYAARAVKHSQ